MPNNSTFDYKPHLKSAYIDPIRTVTVIDDEYPTIDDLILSSKDDFSQENIYRLKEIIDISRSEEYNWLLDVYNGKEQKVREGTVSNRLHHSDLLILDYHLDGEDSGYCKKSIDIIKNLSENRHFNIVAVHTKGYDGQKGSVNEVLIDIITSLQERPSISVLNDKLKSNIDNALDDWEIDEPGVRDELIDSISTIDLLLLIKQFNSDLCSGNFRHENLDVFYDIYGRKPDSIKIPKPLVLKWIISEKLDKYANQFNDKTSKFFDWGINDNCNWIKTEDLFITVLGKKDTPISEIPSQLLEALSNSKPHPHKLILSKLRSEIESNGSFAASNILNKKFLQAAWLKELLENEDEHAIKTAAWQAVTKLWEELAYEIKFNLDEFTINLVRDLKKISSPLDYFIEKSTLDDELEQIKHANCFSCSKKITAHHLVTGHILEFNKNHWLCLTPMCDLVPGQKNGNNLLPVTLVKMYDAKVALNNTRENMQKELKLESLPIINDDEATRQILNYSTQNNLLFIQPELDSKIHILSFTVGLDGKANPKVMDCYVEKQGIFSEEKKVILKYAEPTDNEMNVTSVEAKIIAELRYEYALNLLGRLGVSKSRVGLDFIN
ncbi:response regulator receiver domain [Buttiauxella noackiae]|uniref:response regulator receiver domain n=1 Tax=Buttiauxella noackiae TaxID=82992 RepID=UPI0028D167B4|nr:response regulator receiver domain [Buttiauxella noackiae]